MGDGVEGVRGPDRPSRSAVLVRRKLSRREGRPSGGRRVLVRGNSLCALARKGAPDRRCSGGAPRWATRAVAFPWGNDARTAESPREFRSGRDSPGRVLPSRSEPFRLLRHGRKRSGVAARARLRPGTCAPSSAGRGRIPPTCSSVRNRRAFDPAFANRPSGSGSFVLFPGVDSIERSFLNETSSPRRSPVPGRGLPRRGRTAQAPAAADAWLAGPWTIRPSRHISTSSPTTRSCLRSPRHRHGGEGGRQEGAPVLPEHAGRPGLRASLPGCRVGLREMSSRRSCCTAAERPARTIRASS